MSGNAGDAHIWTITNGLVPVAECGYTPPTQDITAPDPDDPEATVVIGQEIMHAEPTGVTCDDCVTAVAGAGE